MLKRRGVISIKKMKDEYPEIKKEIKEEFAKKKIKKDSQALVHVLSKICEPMELTPLMLDYNIEDIQIMGYDRNVVVSHSQYGVCTTNLIFRKEKKRIMAILDRILLGTNRQISHLNPIIDASMTDGSRINATLHSISPEGPTITIRKFLPKPITIIDFVRRKHITPEVAALLWLYMDGFQTMPLNFIVGGGVGSGKTTLVNALTAFIPPEEVMLTIEDTKELIPLNENVISLLSKPPVIEGTGGITQDFLLKASLRKNPDRIIIGEMRGEEAASLFSAMNIGRKCLTTIHANSAEEAIDRLTNPPMNVPKELTSLIDVIIMTARINKGEKIIRRIFQISEVIKKEGSDEVEINLIYERDPATDSLKKVNELKKVEEIAKNSGMSVEGVLKDLEKRKKIIEKLAESNADLMKIKAVIDKYHRETIKSSLM